jgi:hypothetical protein
MLNVSSSLEAKTTIWADALKVAVVRGVVQLPASQDTLAHIPGKLSSKLTIGQF